MVRTERSRARLRHLVVSSVAACPPALLLLPVWLTIYRSWPISFWSIHDDYAYLSLAHALNLESNLHDGFAYLDFALIGHPGVPYYITSWICLRALALFAGAADPASYGFEHPDSFYLATRVAAGLITIAAVYACWRLLDFLAVPWRLLAIATFFTAGAQSFYYGLTALGNETFALPLAALLFWLVRSLGRQTPPRWHIWPLFGASAALGYLVKPLYLGLLCAVALLAMVDSGYAAAWQKSKWAAGFAWRSSLAGVAFIVVVPTVLLPLIGPGGLKALLSFHFAILTHTGIYGSGESGFASISAIDNATASLLQTSAFPYVVVAAALLLIATVLAQRIVGTLDRAAALWTIAALTGLGFASAAVLKHYAANYVLAVSAILPFAIGPAFDHRYLRWLAAGVAGLGLVAGSSHITEFFSILSTSGLRAAEDEAMIEAMPLQPGEARLWTYHTPTRWFNEGFVASLAGVPWLTKRLQDPQRQEFSSAVHLDRPYRYVVLDRAYYPDLDSVRQATGSLEPTQSVMVPKEKGDQLHLLKSMIVVERVTP
jgi:hypothetical protein